MVGKDGQPKAGYTFNLAIGSSRNKHDPLDRPRQLLEGVWHCTHCYYRGFLNQAHASHRPVCTWFLKIDPVWIVGWYACLCICGVLCVCACVCECAGV